ncbi:MAG: hypothetical protein IJH87_03665, partial [Atopobiaceae bacterium]|nr:hypothetical protein [Atopobiaceae bacterium]
MGFLDDLKERFGFGGGGDDYYDDYYDDEEGQDSFEEEPRRASRRGRDRDYDRDYQPSSVPRVQHDYEGEPQGLLGNTSRPTAESVSVYTRSGHLVDSNSGLRDAAAPAPYSRNAAVTGDSAWT